MPSDIVLIGPFMAGKSTLGGLLARRLGEPNVSLDQLWKDYGKEIGFDQEMDREFRRQGGFVARVLYRNLFNTYAMERMLAEHRDCVFDTGAGPLTFESGEMIARLRRALAPYPNVVMILPSPDPAESIRVLAERAAGEPVTLNFDFFTLFVYYRANYDLAKFIVYTQGKTPEETCDEILDIVIR